MMGMDIRRSTRRQWLAHCSLLGAAFALAGPLASTAAHAAAPTTDPKAATSATVVVVGDSLSAEYGLKRGEGWVELLTQRLLRERPGLKVVNASISGDTTSGGRTRLPSILKTHRPAVVVIELGGNDALRGLPLASTEDNLSAMTRAAKAAGARVLLVGMQVPPNYGRRYTQDFEQMFATVAKAENVSLVPFLLAGVADGPDPQAQFQADRIHPKAEAHPRMLDNVWPQLKPLLP
jgi:acyl-CoA thioesterase I